MPGLVGGIWNMEALAQARVETFSLKVVLVTGMAEDFWQAEEGWDRKRANHQSLGPNISNTS
jgi:hypothetical protein